MWLHFSSTSPFAHSASLFSYKFVLSHPQLTSCMQILSESISNLNQENQREILKAELVRFMNRAERSEYGGQNKKKIEESVISPRFLTSMSRRMCLLLSLERPKIISRVLNMFCFRRLHDLPAQAGNVKYVVNTGVVSFLRSPLQPPLSWPSSLIWSSVITPKLASQL